MPAAALPLIEEQAEVRPLDGRIDVRIREDDVRALAAEFEAHPLEVALSGRLHDDQNPLRAGLAGELQILSTSMCPDSAAPAVGP